MTSHYFYVAININLLINLIPLNMHIKPKVWRDNIKFRWMQMFWVTGDKKKKNITQKSRNSKDVFQKLSKVWRDKITFRNEEKRARLIFNHYIFLFLVKVLTVISAIMSVSYVLGDLGKNFQLLVMFMGCFLKTYIQLIGNIL